MSYVMVPVPEDHVGDVMQYVVRLMSQASIEPWDESSMEELFRDVDEPSRALLSAVAKESLSGKALPDAELTRTIELNWRETMGLLRELNDIARDDGHPPLIIRRTISEPLPNGRTKDVRVLAMNEEIAKLVYAADRAYLLGEAHPLESGDE